MNLVLTGFIASGKTAVGERLARALRRPFVDLDRAIERAAGATIAELFEREGESGFREREAQVCAQVAAEDRRVIATGGGTLVSGSHAADNLAALEASGVVICLDVDAATARRRLAHDDVERPVLGAGSVAAVDALLAGRAPCYAALAHHVEANDGDALAVAARVLELWQKLAHAS